jgi:hypothetical protein
MTLHTLTTSLARSASIEVSVAAEMIVLRACGRLLMWRSRERAHAQLTRVLVLRFVAAASLPRHNTASTYASDAEHTSGSAGGSIQTS